MTLRRSLGRLLIVITMMVAQLGVGGSPARAASFTVNSTSDAADTSPGDGSCDAGGVCTLRAAIEEVNALSGTGHSVSFSISGPAPHTIDISTALPPIAAGVVIDATTQPSFSGTPLIILNWIGGVATTDGIHISGDETTIRGFVVQNFTDEGIEVVGDNSTIAGNYVGVRVDGSTAAGNDDGILVRGANNTIGGPDVADRNVVGGNGDDGISLDSGDDNTVRNNFVGITADGAGTVGNGGEGVAIQFVAVGNVVRDNVIGGNSGAGVLLRSSGTNDNQILGNYIGINPAGTAARANVGPGVWITEGNVSFPGVATDTTIGGGNVISGNSSHGVRVDPGGTGTIIRGNYIGTTASGTAAVANSGDGVYADADDAVIGGTGGGEGNLISGNTGDGVRLEREDQLVQGNLIGTDVTGLLDVGNGGDGIDTGSGTTGSQIGGTSPGAGNTIAFNGGNGVVCREWAGTLGSVVSNNIHSNDQLGINLHPSGETVDTVTLNDPADVDADWPNQLLNFPVIDTAGAALGTTYVDFTLDVPTTEWYRIEFFDNPGGADSSGFGEGQNLVGSLIVQQALLPSGPKTYSVTFPGSPGDVITATTTYCTDSNCNDFISTSEFSAAATVGIVNNPPVLSPIGPQSGDEGTTITFDADASDVDADGITFSLGGTPPAGASIVPNTGVFTWATTEADGPGIYTVRVIVEDDGTPIRSDFEDVEITVNELNEPPTLNPVGDQNAFEQIELTFTASAGDVDIPANNLIFSLSPSAPPGATIGVTGDFSWTPGESNGGSQYTFDVRVSDDGSPPETVMEQITVTVAETNQTPVLASIGDRAITENSLLSFLASATDADLPANSLTFTLEGAGIPPGTAITPGGQFDWTPGETQGPGNYTFDVVVTDDGSPAEEDRETITITVNEDNLAPVLGFIGGQTIQENLQLSFTATASDSDNPAQNLTFTLAGTVPTGASIDPSSGNFTWTPDEVDGPGVFVFDVVVTDDGSPGFEDRETITVSVTEFNTAPVLGPISNRTIWEQTQLTFTAIASDSDVPANALTFFLIGPPTGASIDPNTGVFSWTPSEGQGPGTYVFDVVVIDDGSPSRSASTSVTVDVGEVNTPPFLVSPGNQTGDEGDNITLAIAGSDPDLPANTLSYIASGLPDGLTINQVTGRITGTLARPGHIPTIFAVSVTVSDGAGGFDSVTFSWTVIPTNLMPTASDDAYSVNEGETLVVTSPGVLANDSDPEPQVLTAGLVTGPSHGDLLLSSDGSFTYIHTGATDTDDSFIYRLSDGHGGFDTALVTIDVIRVNETPIASPDAIEVDEDTVIVFDPLANDSDADGDPLVIVAISQPANGSLRVEGGQLRFVPDPNYFGMTIGSYTVADGRGASATAIIQITVRPVNDAPVGTPDSVTLRNYLTVSIPVLLNDTDIDGDQLSIASVIGSGIGEVDVDGDLLIFKAPSGWVGTTTLTYTVVDPDGAADTVEVSVTVSEQTLVTAHSLLDDLESGTNDLAILGPTGEGGLASLNPVESVSLLVDAFYQTLGAFQLPLVFLGLSMFVLIGLGGVSKIPLLMAGRVRSHWSVVLLDREDALAVHQDPDAESSVIYNYNPTTESVHSTGRPLVVDDTEWMPVHTPSGEGWVDVFHLTEQIDVEEFANDKRPPRLVNEFADTLRAGGDVTSFIADKGIVLALTGPPTRLAQQQFGDLLAGARLRMLPTVGGVLHAQEDFRIAVAEPLLAAYDATGEVTAGVAHSQNALIPAEVWNFRYLALGEGTPQPWLVFFEYEQGVPRIVGLGIDE